MNGNSSFGSSPIERWPSAFNSLTTLGTRLCLFATALVVLAFLTNPHPTQDLPGVGLPLTLPVTQPRWGHSAVSYLVGMWLFEFTFPVAVLAAARRWGTSTRRTRSLLLGLPATYMLTLYLYCRFHYLPNVTPTPLGPAATGLCWAYCGTGDAIWGMATAAVALLGIGLWGYAASGRQGRGWLALLFGTLSLPLGIPALYWGWDVIRGD